MQFLDFHHQLSAYPVFSLKDVRKVLPSCNRIQLDRWEKKGYLTKIRRGFYCFSDQKGDPNFLLYAASKLYAPSYISLETALKQYGLLPEEIFQVTSVSTKKMTHFETPIGNFRYRHMKPGLFWGYKIVESRPGNPGILLAEPEKAILDYLYVHPQLKTAHDFEGMRINVDEFRLHMNLETLQKYLDAFGQKQLSKRVTVFLTTILHDIT